MKMQALHDQDESNREFFFYILFLHLYKLIIIFSIKKKFYLYIYILQFFLNEKKIIFCSEIL